VIYSAFRLEKTEAQLEKQRRKETELKEELAKLQLEKDKLSSSLSKLEHKVRIPASTQC
jgi:cell division protein FtsB